MIQMEADRLRENPQTPHQQETLQAITQGCTRLRRLLLAANNQATRRRKHKKLPSASFNWVQAATDMHPACPNKKQNHLQNSLLRRTQFWVRKSFSKPASLKRASLVFHCFLLGVCFCFAVVCLFVFFVAGVGFWFCCLCLLVWLFSEH